jgi:hypothetical protein
MMTSWMPYEITSAGAGADASAAARLAPPELLAWLHR